MASKGRRSSGGSKMKRSDKWQVKSGVLQVGERAYAVVHRDRLKHSDCVPASHIFASLGDGDGKSYFCLATICIDQALRANLSTVISARLQQA